MIKNKIVFITATPITANAFLLDFFRVLHRDYEIYLISNFSENPEYKIDLPFLIQVDIPIQRNINIIKDLVCLYKITLFLFKNKVSVVHSVTPKAGLLGMLSSKIALVNCRFHTFTGQVWANYTGFKRYVFMSIDKLIFKLTSVCLVDSFSQKQYLLQHKIINDNSHVLGDGSISGVDLKRFIQNQDVRVKQRQKYNIQNSDIVFLFLGRVNQDKGIRDLIQAFLDLSNELKCIKLFIVGPDEEGITIDISNENIKCIGFTSAPQKFMNMADVFCLPSYREGFGSVVLEAAACGTPSIGSNIYGLNDAIIQNQTGILHEVKNISEINAAMRKLAINNELRQKLAHNAKDRVVSQFSKERLSQCLLDFYKKNVF